MTENKRAIKEHHRALMLELEKQKNVHGYDNARNSDELPTRRIPRKLFCLMEVKT
jgi:hypothetical protein